MKTRKILIGVLLFLLTGVIFIACFMFFMFHSWDNNMEKGKQIMSSLTDDELAHWINDAVKLHSIDSLRAIGIGALFENDPLFKDNYVKLDIIRIDVNDNEVRYVWMGGFDHTYLTFTISNQEVEHVVARYNDYASQKLFPELKRVVFSENYSEKMKFVGNTVLKNHNK